MKIGMEDVPKKETAWERGLRRAKEVGLA